MVPSYQELYEADEAERLRLQNEEEEIEELYRAEARAGVRDFHNEHLRV